MVATAYLVITLAVHPEIIIDVFISCANRKGELAEHPCPRHEQGGGCLPGIRHRGGDVLAHLLVQHAVVERGARVAVLRTYCEVPFRERELKV